MEFDIRPGDYSKDAPFVFETAARASSSVLPFSLTPREQHVLDMRQRINDWFDIQSGGRRNSVYVAHVPGEEDEIVGYVVGELSFSQLRIDMVYVKHVFRGMGVATQLINALWPGYLASKAPIEVSSWSRACRGLLDKHKLVYIV